MTEDEFKFILVDDPPSPITWGLYPKIVQAFRDSEHDIVELSVPGKKHRTVRVGVLMELRRKKIGDMHVFTRAGKVYLMKKKNS